MQVNSESHSARVAIVTGAGSGLGRVMAIALAKSGARVVAAGLGKPNLEETCSAAPKPNQMLAVESDLTEDGAIEALVDQTVEHFGSLDILVNNAGVTAHLLRQWRGEEPPKWDNVRQDEFRTVLEINTIVPFFLARAAVPKMLERERPWGRIVNITTSLDTMLNKDFVPYGCSKAATEANSVVLAENLRGTGVTVNVLTPGGPAFSPMAVASDPQSKYISPDKMAPPIVWLTSDAAADVTAQRVIALKWDESLDPLDAMAAAGAPAAWQQLGKQSVRLSNTN